MVRAIGRPIGGLSSTLATLAFERRQSTRPSRSSTAFARLEPLRSRPHALLSLRQRGSEWLRSLLLADVADPVPVSPEFMIARFTHVDLSCSAQTCKRDQDAADLALRLSLRPRINVTDKHFHVFLGATVCLSEFQCFFQKSMRPFLAIFSHTPWKAGQNPFLDPPLEGPSFHQLSALAQLVQGTRIKIK